MALLLPIAGTISTFFAFNRAIFLKFPDLSVKETGDGYAFPSFQHSTFGAFRSWALIVAVPGIVVFFVAESLVMFRIASKIKSGLLRPPDRVLGTRLR